MERVADTDSLMTTRLDRVGYLFGQKITNSLSPLLHNTIYQKLGLKWAQLRLDSSDIDGFLKLAREDKFYGASVTMPNKVTIMPYLDEVTEECRQIGACNTVFLKHKNGKRLLCGTNTDAFGIREAFYQNVPDPEAAFHNRSALVIGGGGAARSAVYSLRKWMKMKTIYFVNRDKAEIDTILLDCQDKGYGKDLVHLSTLGEAQSAETPGIVVACLPDIPPKTSEEIRCREIVEELLHRKPGGIVLEMCYNPSPYTALGALAEKHGWKVILGTEAMIFQGLEQDLYWTGLDIKDLPVKEVRSIVAASLAGISRL